MTHFTCSFPALPLPPRLEECPVVAPIKAPERLFTLVEKLGEGGNGVVYGALTPRKTRRVAIKIPHPGKGFLEQTIQEVWALKLGARHAVGLLEDFDLAPTPEEYRSLGKNLWIGHEKGDERRHAIVMDFLPCPDTAKMCRTFGCIYKFSFEKVMSIGRQTLEMLADFQQKGAAHRDLKPANIVYHEMTDELFICDFGAAMKSSREINPYAMAQTRWYRAPEHLLWQRYGKGVDLWSLGCVLFELYTATPLIPSLGEDDSATIIDHLHLMVKNIGEVLNPKFIQYTPSKLRNKVFKKIDGTYQIASSPSREAQLSLDYYDRIAQSVKERCGSMPIWQARIHYAALWKKETENQANDLIALIGSMLQYRPKDRMNPEIALKKFFG